MHDVRIKFLDGLLQLCRECPPKAVALFPLSKGNTHGWYKQNIVLDLLRWIYAAGDDPHWYALQRVAFIVDTRRKEKRRGGREEV
jgi:hypothetical protein